LGERDSFLIPRVLSLPTREHVTTIGSRIQINKERNIAAPDKVWGNPTQKMKDANIIIKKSSVNFSLARLWQKQ